MAIIDADFPSGSHGIYGNDISKALNGRWAELFNSPSLINDPDPLIGSNGFVLKLPGGASREVRYVLPAPQSTVGTAMRVWFPAIPSNSLSKAAFVAWKNAANVTIAYAFVTPTGSIAFCNGSDANQAILFESAGPEITANAWWHVEAKLVCGTTSNASVEIRVNGTTVLTGSGFSTSAATVSHASILPLANGSALFAEFYVKDWVLWDGTGTTGNNFLGSVSVFYRKVTGTINIGGWTLSAGATATNLLDGPRPSNVLTATGNLTPDGTNNIQIGGVYYRPTSGGVNVGTPAGTSANPWLVALGVDTATSLANLFNAINASGTAGTTYSTALTAHPTVSAVGYDATRVLIQSDDGTTTSYSCTETMANASWASSTINSIIPQDLAYIAADATPPAACEFDLEDLPIDITSVRAIVPVVRGAKVDGGDGNLQLSLSPDGVNYDSGPDTAITTAFTFWPNNTAPFVSKTNPATSAPWTPTQFNGARLKINRTL